MMMKLSRFFVVPALCAIMTAFSACPTEPEELPQEKETEVEAEMKETLEETGTTRTLRNIKVAKDPLFYSLSAGKQVSDPKTQEWDIAFPGVRQIWTNSGDTAAKYDSNGQGGVWYTNKTNFDDVTGRDQAVTEDETPALQILKNFNTDKARWVTGMDANANFADFYKQVNVMSFVGHGNENEPGVGMSKDTAYNVLYGYDKKQFYYNAAGMPPVFQPTKQVYIIRHGDGVHYSKFQVIAYTRNPDTFAIKFAPLPEKE
jgi:hypothetical protein